MSNSEDFCACGRTVVCQRRRDAAHHLADGDPHEGACTIGWEPRDGQPVMVCGTGMRAA